MVRVDMRLVGARRARAKLYATGPKVRLATRAGVREWADAAKGIMRSIVPKDSGKLQDAIEVEEVSRVARGWAAFIGPGNRVRYAAFVEYGTKDTPEQPYARPTTQLASKVGPNIITRAVKKVL